MDFKILCLVVLGFALVQATPQATQNNEASGALAPIKAYLKEKFEALEKSRAAFMERLREQREPSELEKPQTIPMYPGKPTSPRTIISNDLSDRLVMDRRKRSENTSTSRQVRFNCANLDQRNNETSYIENNTTAEVNNCTVSSSWQESPENNNSSQILHAEEENQGPKNLPEYARSDWEKAVYASYLEALRKDQRSNNSADNETTSSWEESREGNNSSQILDAERENEGSGHFGATNLTESNNSWGDLHKADQDEGSGDNETTVDYPTTSTEEMTTILVSNSSESLLEEQKNETPIDSETTTSAAAAEEVTTSLSSGSLQEETHDTKYVETTVASVEVTVPQNSSEGLEVERRNDKSGNDTTTTVVERVTEAYSLLTPATTTEATSLRKLSRKELREQLRRHLEAIKQIREALRRDPREKRRRHTRASSEYWLYGIAF